MLFVIFSGPIERQNVQLASAVFHESTIHALKYYGEQGHNEFIETAEFLTIVHSWWKLVNVKSIFHSARKLDPFREAITEENLIEKTSFLRGFVDWLQLWEETSQNGLSSDTFKCAQHASAALAELAEHLIQVQKFQYFLTGKAQSDKIEKRFGKSRQMTGGNLYASVRQFLETERTLRIKNLAKLNLSLSEIKEIFSESNKNHTELEKITAQKIFAALIKEVSVEFSRNPPEAEANLLFYVAGGFARSICQQIKCDSCKDLTITNQKFQVEDANKPVSSANADFLNQVNRGGLTIPSELSFLTCVQSWKIFSHISESESLQNLLYRVNLSSLTIFQNVFDLYLSSHNEARFIFLEQRCRQGHPFRNISSRLSAKIFNLFSKNLSSVLNSEIHSKRGRKTDDYKRHPLASKVAKLQSEQL